ncbi:MAG: hypothetical protein QME21_19165 [Anaerolineales bacterium]|nr:hypothetical protein [Anaerolineales bacterium]
MVAFAIALILDLLFIPLIRRVSLRLGRVAQPRPDRWHRQPTPTLGGLGIFAAFVLALLASRLLPGGESIGSNWAFLSGAAMMFLLGLYDEFRPMSPSAKLVGQILAAAVVILLGYTSAFFTPKIANTLIAQIPNILLTFIWLVGITNAINLLDNMDGLAGGIAFITAGVLSYFFWRTGDRSLLIISLALAGSVLGFLVFNFPPARIFMGDSGSLFLGFTLATLAIVHQKQQASDVLAVLGVPTLLFMLPILDTILVTFTRLLRGQSPAQGGRDHTSHRLIAFGLSERQALFVLYGVALLSAVMAAVIESVNYWLSLALVPFLLVVMALLAAYLGGVKVVSAPEVSRQREAIARWMVELTYRARVLEVLLDFILIGLVYYLAFLVRFGLVFNEARLELYLQTLPLALGGSYLAFYIFGVYRGVWRYVSFDDLLRFVQAALGSATLLAASIFILGSTDLAPWQDDFSNLILALFALFLFMGLAVSRSSFRLLDRLAFQRPRQDELPVLIYGAGDAGELALRWIQANPQMNFRPVGFIDDDPLKLGRQIHGIEILGATRELPTILKRRPIAGVILASPEITAERRQSVLQICRQYGCWVRSLHMEFELLD